MMAYLTLYYGARTYKHFIYGIDIAVYYYLLIFVQNIYKKALIGIENVRIKHFL